MAIYRQIRVYESVEEANAFLKLAGMDANIISISDHEGMKLKIYISSTLRSREW